MIVSFPALPWTTVGIVRALATEMYSLFGPPLIATMSISDLLKRRIGRESTCAVTRPLLSRPTVIFESFVSPVTVRMPLLRVMFELVDPVEPPEPGVMGGGVGLGVPVIGGGVTGAPPL